LDSSLLSHFLPQLTCSAADIDADRGETIGVFLGDAPRIVLRLEIEGYKEAIAGGERISEMKKHPHR
jgi:hypothetical protein